MCGIVGYIGDQQAAPILLAGLANWNIEDMIQPEFQSVMKLTVRLKL